jgi:hypothetical protein
MTRICIKVEVKFHSSRREHSVEPRNQFHASVALYWGKTPRKSLEGGLSKDYNFIFCLTKFGFRLIKSNIESRRVRTKCRTDGLGLRTVLLPVRNLLPSSGRCLQSNYLATGLHDTISYVNLHVFIASILLIISLKIKSICNGKFMMLMVITIVMSQISV